MFLSDAQIGPAEGAYAASIAVLRRVCPHIALASRCVRSLLLLSWASISVPKIHRMLHTAAVL